MIFLNNVQVVPTIFPDKTSQVWKLDQLQKFNNVLWFWQNETEIFHIRQLVKLILETNNSSLVNITIPYMPYARQDKDVDNNQSFAGQVFHKMILNLAHNRDGISTNVWNTISSYDVHRPSFYSQLDNFENIIPLNTIQNIASKYDYVIYPDYGAGNRYNNQIKGKNGCLIFEKIRDSNTGEITSIRLCNSRNVLIDVKNTIDIQNSSVLVVDDICDGGATFNALADTLHLNPYNSALYVTHGLFSKGLEELSKRYYKIYTTNTWWPRFKEWYFGKGNQDISHEQSFRILNVVNNQINLTL